MALKRTIMAIVMLAGAAVAQPTIFVTTNNHNTLNPETDALSGPAGSFRITHTVTDGVDPLSFEFLQSPVLLKCVNQADAFTNLFTSAFATNDPGTVRWLITNLNAGVYTLDSDIVIGGDTIKIFWRYLTVTNTPSAGTTISLYNIDAYTVTATSGVFDTLTAGNLNVTNAISAADTGAVKLVGSDMTGGLTNRTAAGFVGNGVNLTGVVASVTQTGQVDSLTVTGYVVRGGVVLEGSAVTATGQTINIAGSAGQKVEYIGGYTYTGGESLVTVAWGTTYQRIDLLLTGDLVGVPGTNAHAANGANWCVQINGIPKNNRSNILFDNNADAYPATADAYNGITNVVRLHLVPTTNSTTPFAYPTTQVGEWSFFPSVRGVHVRGSGHGFFTAGNATYLQIGYVATNDFVNANAITQMQFGIYNITNGALFSSISNATFRLWGARYD